MPAVDLERIAGHWKGSTEVAGVETPWGIEVTSVVDGGNLEGTIDMPLRSTFALPLTNLTYDDRGLRFELDLPVGLATWAGRLRDNIIEGEFTEAGLKGTFSLQRTAGAAADATNDDAEGLFRREQVVLSSIRVTVAGNLTFPVGQGPHPAVVLINGSHGQDRDSNVFGFRMFASLADHLASNGTAVLRFDDRGVGGSTGDGWETTIRDWAGNVSTGVDYLASRDDMNGDRIGLIGRGVGGLVAPMVGNRTGEVAFIALLAAPAMSGADALREQLQTSQRLNGGSAEMLAAQRAYQEQMPRAVMTGEGWKEVEACFRERLLDAREGMHEAITNPYLSLESRVAAQLAWLRSPWFKSFVEYDLRQEIVALDIAVLALFTAVDIYRRAESNSDSLSEAIAASAVSSHTISTLMADHTFLDPLAGLVAHEAGEQRDFAPEFLEIPLQWLAEQTGTP